MWTLLCCILFLSPVQAFYLIKQYTVQYPTFLLNRQIVLNEAIGQLDGLPPEWDVVPAYFDLTGQTNRSLGQNFDTDDLTAYYSALWRARCVRPSILGVDSSFPCMRCKWACHDTWMLMPAMVSG